MPIICTKCWCCRVGDAIRFKIDIMFYNVAIRAKPMGRWINDCDKHRWCVSCVVNDNGLAFPVMASCASGSLGRRAGDLPSSSGDSGLMTSRSNGSVGSLMATCTAVPPRLHHHHHPTIDAAKVLATAAGLAASCHFDLNFLDLPTEDGYPPRLKRYPSARASSMWRHK